MFDASKVTKIYMGRDRVCRCGCAGEYVSRGKQGHLAEKFDKRVARFAKMWAEYIPDPKDDIGDNYLNISYGKNRALTVYFD